MNLANELYINPVLSQYLRPNAKKSKHIKEVLRKLERLTNEFPNLYKELLKN